MITPASIFAGHFRCMAELVLDINAHRLRRGARSACREWPEIFCRSLPFAEVGRGRGVAEAAISLSFIRSGPTSAFSCDAAKEEALGALCEPDPVSPATNGQVASEGLRRPRAPTNRSCPASLPTALVEGLDAATPLLLRIAWSRPVTLVEAQATGKTEQEHGAIAQATQSA